MSINQKDMSPTSQLQQCADMAQAILDEMPAPVSKHEAAICKRKAMLQEELQDLNSIQGDEVLSQEQVQMIKELQDLRIAQADLDRLESESRALEKQDRQGFLDVSKARLDLGSLLQRKEERKEAEAEAIGDRRAKDRPKKLQKKIDELTALINKKKEEMAEAEQELKVRVDAELEIQSKVDRMKRKDMESSKFCQQDRDKVEKLYRDKDANESKKKGAEQQMILEENKIQESKNRLGPLRREIEKAEENIKIYKNRWEEAANRGTAYFYWGDLPFTKDQCQNAFKGIEVSPGVEVSHDDIRKKHNDPLIWMCCHTSDELRLYYESRIKSCEKEKEAAEKALADEEQNLATLTKVVVDLNGTIDEAKATQARLDKDIEDHVKLSKTNCGDRQKHANDVGGESTKLEGAKKMVESSKQQVGALREDLHRLESRKVDLEEKLRRLSGFAGRSMGKIRRYCHILEENEMRASSEINKLVAMREELVFSLQCDITVKKEEIKLLGSQDRLFQDLMTKGNSYDREDPSDVELESVDSKLADLENQMAAILGGNKWKELQRETEETVGKLCAVKHRLIEIEDELDDKNDEVDKLNSDIDMGKKNRVLSEERKEQLKKIEKDLFSLGDDAEPPAGGVQEHAKGSYIVRKEQLDGEIRQQERKIKDQKEKIDKLTVEINIEGVALGESQVMTLTRNELETEMTKAQTELMLKKQDLEKVEKSLNKEKVKLSSTIAKLDSEIKETGTRIAMQKDVLSGLQRERNAKKEEQGRVEREAEELKMKIVKNEGGGLPQAIKDALKNEFNNLSAKQCKMRIEREEWRALQMLRDADSAERAKVKCKEWSEKARVQLQQVNEAMESILKQRDSSKLEEQSAELKTRNQTLKEKISGHKLEISKLSKKRLEAKTVLKQMKDEGMKLDSVIERLTMWLELMNVPKVVIDHQQRGGHFFDSQNQYHGWDRDEMKLLTREGLATKYENSKHYLVDDKNSRHYLVDEKILTSADCIAVKSDDRFRAIPLRALRREAGFIFVPKDEGDMKLQEVVTKMISTKDEDKDWVRDRSFSYTDEEFQTCPTLIRDRMVQQNELNLLDKLAYCTHKRGVQEENKKKIVGGLDAQLKELYKDIESREISLLQSMEATYNDSVEHLNKVLDRIQTVAGSLSAANTQIRIQIRIQRATVARLSTKINDFTRRRYEFLEELGKLNSTATSAEVSSEERSKVEAKVAKTRKELLDSRKKVVQTLMLEAEAELKGLRDSEGERSSDLESRILGVGAVLCGFERLQERDSSRRLSQAESLVACLFMAVKGQTALFRARGLNLLARDFSDESDPLSTLLADSKAKLSKAGEIEVMIREVVNLMNSSGLLRPIAAIFRGRQIPDDLEGDKQVVHICVDQNRQFFSVCKFEVHKFDASDELADLEYRIAFVFDLLLHQRVVYKRACLQDIQKQKKDIAQCTLEELESIYRQQQDELAKVTDMKAFGAFFRDKFPQMGTVEQAAEVQPGIAVEEVQKDNSDKVQPDDGDIQKYQ